MIEPADRNTCVTVRRSETDVSVEPTCSCTGSETETSSCTGLLPVEEPTCGDSLQMQHVVSSVEALTLTSSQTTRTRSEC